MKTHLINAGNTVFTTVVTAIVGPIFGTTKKLWMMMKQSWKSLKDAVNYIKSPENKGKPIGRLLLETGKILIAGVTGTNAIVLGELIEKGLMTIPIFAVEIPLIGSLANILGIFFGAIVAGIMGAIAINLIEKLSDKRQKEDIADAKVKKANEVIKVQYQLRSVNEVKLNQTKASTVNEIKDRHQMAADMMSDSISKITANCEQDQDIQETFNDIDNLLDQLEGSL